MASIYRAGIWFLQGWRNYGKSGYERASKGFDPKALDVNLNDQVAIVTGSNSGLGLETSYELAKRGAKVYMLCRDMTKGFAAIEELKQRNSDISDDKLILRKVDVSSQSDIKDFVTNLQEDSLDILVNNAGCMVDGRQMTSEGIEMNFATNVIGPFLMTETLIPKLSKSKRGAVVLTVTSGGMLTQKMEPNDIQLSKCIKGIDLYAQNKVNIRSVDLKFSSFFVETAS